MTAESTSRIDTSRPQLGLDARGERAILRGILAPEEPAPLVRAEFPSAHGRSDQWTRRSADHDTERASPTYRPRPGPGGGGDPPRRRGRRLVRTGAEEAGRAGAGADPDGDAAGQAR